MFARPALRTLTRLGACLGLCVALAACNAPQRLANVGLEPAQSPIEDPSKITGNAPLMMPMPYPQVQEPPHGNSLWRTGSRAFFKDQRAGAVGDILTVVIDINDNAALNNQSARSRDAGENAGLSSFLGFESRLNRVLPDAVNPGSLIDAQSGSNYGGQGSVARSEEIELKIAAIITQVLPNGNLVLAGRQEVRVNYENRILQVAGVIRPEDITSINTINYDQIAEARIAYGGQGQLTDVQQPRYGQQIYDILWPF